MDGIDGQLGASASTPWAPQPGAARAHGQPLAAGVHERLRRLEARGIIRGYTALVDWEAPGLPITAFIWVRSAGVQCSTVGQAILRLSDAQSLVEACHRVTGDWCMLLQVRTASPLTLQGLIDRIRAVPGVQGTTTNLALSTLSDAADEPTKEQNHVDLGHAGR